MHQQSCPTGVFRGNIGRSILRGSVYLTAPGVKCSHGETKLQYCCRAVGHAEDTQAHVCIEKGTLEPSSPLVPRSADGWSMYFTVYGHPTRPCRGSSITHIWDMEVVSSPIQLEGREEFRESEMSFFGGKKHHDFRFCCRRRECQRRFPSTAMPNSIDSTTTRTYLLSTFGVFITEATRHANHSEPCCPHSIISHTPSAATVASTGSQQSPPEVGSTLERKRTSLLWPSSPTAFPTRVSSALTTRQEDKYSFTVSTRLDSLHVCIACLRKARVRAISWRFLPRYMQEVGDAGQCRAGGWERVYHTSQ